MHYLTGPSAIREDSNTPTFSLTLVVAHVKKTTATPVSVMSYITVVLIFIFLMTTDAEHFFVCPVSCLFWRDIYSDVQILGLFLNWIFIFL